MSNWRIYENEEQVYVAVAADLSEHSIHIIGEPCFGGQNVPEVLVSRLLTRFGGYRFDWNGMRVFKPAGVTFLQQHQIAA